MVGRPVMPNHAGKTSLEPEESLRTFRIELRASALAYLVKGLVERQAVAVGAIARHGVEGVSHGHDPGNTRNFRTGKTIRIAAATENV